MHVARFSVQRASNAQTIQFVTFCYETKFRNAFLGRHAVSHGNQHVWLAVHLRFKQTNQAMRPCCRCSSYHPVQDWTKSFKGSDFAAKRTGCARGARPRTNGFSKSGIRLRRFAALNCSALFQQTSDWPVLRLVSFAHAVFCTAPLLLWCHKAARKAAVRRAGCFRAAGPRLKLT